MPVCIILGHCGEVGSSGGWGMRVKKPLRLPEAAAGVPPVLREISGEDDLATRGGESCVCRLAR